MANCSYLFAADAIPSGTLTAGEMRMIGISEWAYDIPVAFQCLLSVNTQRCRSSIFASNELIALVGDYDTGVATLFEYLGGLPHPAVVALMDEAREFLTAPENRRRYFILECGEIFEMNEEGMEEQNAELLKRIQGLKSRGATRSDTSGGEVRRRGILSRLFGGPVVKNAIPPMDVNTLGLGNWSNHLRVDPHGGE